MTPEQRSNLKKLAPHLPSLQAALTRLDALEQALTFYADPETYFAIAFLFDPPCGEFREDFSDIGNPFWRPMPGKRARDILGS